MRALVCSAVLWAAFTMVIVPTSGLAQAYQPTQQQGRQGHTPNPPANPLVQGLFNHLLQQIPQQGDDVGRPGTSVDPPSTNVDPPVVAVPVRDTTPPVIRVARDTFSSSGKSIQVRATITDNRAVRGAAVVGKGVKQRMQAEGSGRYVATIPLLPEYYQTGVKIEAWDRSGNSARPVQIVVRRVPGCGLAKGATAALIRQVQTGLAALGRYRGGIDGDAGRGTCGALDGLGIKDDFQWPGAKTLVDGLVAESRIRLTADLPDVALSEMNAIRVRVTEPTNSRRVASVRMSIDGRPIATLPNDTGELGFMLMIAEGATHKVVFEALDRSRAKVWATATGTVTRPEALTLDLSGGELVDARIESEAAQVRITATLGGAPTGRVFLENGTGLGRVFRDYAGFPLDFDIAMPAPGDSATAVFWAQSGNRNVPRQRIELVRLRVVVPAPWVGDISQPPMLVPDQPPGLTATAPPGRVPAPVPVTAPVADKLPEVDPNPHIPPPPAPPPWLIPVGLGLMLLFGMIGGLKSLYRYGLRPQRAVVPKGPPTLRVVAVPDRAPDVAVTGADMPGLMLTVDPGVQGEMLVEYEEEQEVAAQ